MDAGNMMDNPWPLYIVIPWTLVFFLCCFGYMYLRSKKDRTTMYGWEYLIETDNNSAEKRLDEKTVSDEKVSKEKKKKEKKEFIKKNK